MAQRERSDRGLLQFDPVDGPRPAEAIAAQIRQRIGSRDLCVGDKLPTERELAEQFQVSRNSLRQALHSLTELGLLEIRKGARGGAFVTGSGEQAVSNTLTDLFHLGTIAPHELTEVRLLIGVEVARMACQRATAEEIERLESNVREAEQAAAAGDFGRRTDLNLEFHRLLAAMTHNRLLTLLADAVLSATRQFVRRIGPVPNASVMPVRRRLLRLLRQRDSDGMAKAMHSHLMAQQRLYLRSLEALQKPAEAPSVPAVRRRRAMAPGDSR